MTGKTELRCDCGCVALEVSGDPIISAQCYCSSCRTAGDSLAHMGGAHSNPVQPDGGTGFVLYRKDRVRVVKGMERLRAFRLTAKASTRRVVATCCTMPVFLEFKGGHWLSLYAGLWADGTAPKAQLRTQTGDAPEGAVMTGDVPSGLMADLGFYRRLLGAWIAMGFRVPKVEVAEAEVFLSPDGKGV